MYIHDIYHLSFYFQCKVVSACQLFVIQDDDYGQLFTALDSCCLAVAVLEVLLKLYADFRGFWRCGWDVFNFLVVAASLIAPSITTPPFDYSRFVTISDAWMSDCRFYFSR